MAFQCLGSCGSSAGLLAPKDLGPMGCPILRNPSSERKKGLEK